MSSTNITWHPSKLSHQQRSTALKAKGAVIWLTGLSGSGKSTIARELEYLLVKQGVFCSALDGDNLRHGLNSDLGFSPEDRQENIRRIAEVSRLMAEANLIVIASFISPYASDREKVRKRLQHIPFIEVFVDTPLDICQQRDPKGLYRRAMAGEIKQFTGISAPYEAPSNPDIHLHSDQMNPTQCADLILQFMHEGDIVLAQC